MNQAQISALAAGVANLIAQSVGGTSEGVVAAAAVATPVATPVRAASCGCARTSTSTSSTTKKSVKRDLPGFTDQSATVTLRRFRGRDEFIVEAHNQFRGPVSFTIPADGYVKRSSVTAQLKLGVLKINYAVYNLNAVSSYTVDSDNDTKRVAITLKSGR